MTTQELDQVRYLENEVRSLTETVGVLRKELEWYIEKTNVGHVEGDVCYMRFTVALSRADNLRDHQLRKH